MIWRYAVIIVAGYLLGNISMGLIVSERYHMDIREHGSGNAGTTNVLRTLGWLPSVLTLVGDVLKSFFACLLGKWLAGETGLLVGGFMAVIGHNWPAFSGFRGGKGMAASLGIIFALSWQMALGFLGLEVLVAALTGYVSVASLTTAAAFPIVMGIVYRNSPNFWMYLIFAILLAAAAIFSHRTNIQRLLQGKENRMDFKKIKVKPDDNDKTKG